MKYTFDDYTLTLEDTGYTNELGKAIVAYEFTDPKGEVLFSGKDFYPSPLHDSESLEAAKSLLGFLTLREGDTDSEYFEKYTPRQLEFSRSMDCEALQIYSLED